MNKLETIKLVLTLVSGICWTVVYIDGIRLGIRDRSYAIPFYALALNIFWELLQTFYGLQSALSVQTVITRRRLFGVSAKPFVVGFVH